MLFYLFAYFVYSEWRPHFAFLDTPHANEMMALRWLHLSSGSFGLTASIFFNLVLTPCDETVRSQATNQNLSGADAGGHGLVPSSALVT